MSWYTGIAISKKECSDLVDDGIVPSNVDIWLENVMKWSNDYDQVQVNLPNNKLWNWNVLTTKERFDKWWANHDDVGEDFLILPNGQYGSWSVLDAYFENYKKTGQMEYIVYSVMAHG